MPRKTAFLSQLFYLSTVAKTLFSSCLQLSWGDAGHIQQDETSYRPLLLLLGIFYGRRSNFYSILLRTLQQEKKQLHIRVISVFV